MRGLCLGMGELPSGLLAGWHLVKMAGFSSIELLLYICKAFEAVRYVV